MVAGIPASLYTVQNMAALMAYQNLDALTFNVLNQTKTLSAAFCLYLVMGRQQSAVQAMALILLLVSALVMEGIIPLEKLLFAADATSESAKDDDTKEWSSNHVTYGLMPIFLASFISGLAGALTQRSLQAAGGGRNSLLFSMELCAATTLILGFSLAFSPDGQSMTENGFWQNWTPQTWIPVITNASGGVLVGLVTKYAGSVRKGFALIFGMLMSGVVQGWVEPDVGVSSGQIAGGCLAAFSLYLHATNPPGAPKTVKQD
jgi:UDP-sugar transporter A1/2/3